MKRIALAVALVVIAAGACKKAADRGMAADSARADSMKMADSMRWAADTAHHMVDTAKAHPAQPIRRQPDRRQPDRRAARSDAVVRAGSSPGAARLLFCAVARVIAVRVSNGGSHPSSRRMRSTEYGFSPRMNDIAEFPSAV